MKFFMKITVAFALRVSVLLSVIKLSESRSSQGWVRPQRQLLVGYWGQNAAGPKLADSSKYEKPLSYFCQEQKYDIIVIGFVVPLFHRLNKDELPGINLAHHCAFAANRHYPYLYSCPQIERDIKTCQESGIKVTISIGGSTGNGSLASSGRALKLAHNLWNLFLGGKDSLLVPLRPFGSAVLDGVDLDVEQGSYKHYPIFVKELHRLMKTDTSKKFIISAAPQCPYPDRILGPQIDGTPLNDTGEYFNHIYIQFYNNFCWPGDPKWFNSTLTQWLTFATRTGALVFIGLPAGIHASSSPRYYIPPNKLEPIYKSIRNLPGVGGVMLWDCSSDQNNLLGNSSHVYSQFVHSLLLKGEEFTSSPTPSVTPNFTPNFTSKANLNVVSFSAIVVFLSLYFLFTLFR